MIGFATRPLTEEATHPRDIVVLAVDDADIRRWSVEWNELADEVTFVREGGRGWAALSGIRFSTLFVTEAADELARIGGTHPSGWVVLQLNRRLANVPMWLRDAA